ncbi:hypothetical protein [Streptomyces sp. NPDC049879]|uniref:hypothetical protein n=1 Tax=Streptomyces sp. NPDC049879 TaxID=3365598 RepID=UPI0037B05DBF
MADQDLHNQESRRVVERLTGAGWELAEGAARLGRAALVHDNGRMAIEVERTFDERELSLHLLSPDGRAVTLFPVYGDSLEGTLDAIVGFQDRVSPEDFHGMVEAVVVACPEVYLQEGEDDEPRLLTLG